MSEAGVWAPTPGTDVEVAWPRAGAVLSASAGPWQAAGPGKEALDEEDLDVDEALDEEDLDDDEDEDEDDEDEDDDLDEFEDDELDDEEDDDEADEIDFTEDRYGRIPGEDDADV
jgi:hypothetical protein